MGSHSVSPRRLARGAAGVLDMDVEAEAYRDVFTASAAPRASRRGRIEATVQAALVRTTTLVVKMIREGYES